MDRTAAPKGHPKGLYRCFWVEMWERFSYYGMRALLVLYMVSYQGWQPTEASGVYKWYTSLVYLTPLLGGFLADRYIGLRWSIIIGGTLMAIGHFLMAFEAVPIFFTALGFLILGNGFFKPNMSTLIGQMYKEGDPRRDGGFTIFYMGINLGAFLAPIACGWLREEYGFHYGFTLAGVGMVAGLIVFLVTQKQIIDDVEAAGHKLKQGKDKVAEEHAADPNEKLDKASGSASMVGLIYRVFLVLGPLALCGYYAFEVLQGRQHWTQLIMPGIMSVVFVWMTLTINSIKGASQDMTVSIFIFFIFSVLFWMAFEQAGNSMNLWAMYHTDLKIPFTDKTYPAEYWQSMNPLLIFILAPLFAWAWTWLSKRDKEPTTATKMFFGLALVTLSFVPMVYAAQVENRTVSEQSLSSLPIVTVKKKDKQGNEVKSREELKLNEMAKELNAGRLWYDKKANKLVVRGALPHYVTNELLHKMVPEALRKEVDTLPELTRKATKKAPVTYTFKSVGPTYKLNLGKKDQEKHHITWDPKRRTITFSSMVQQNTRNELLSGGATPQFRDALWSLEKSSQRARVSGFWLFLAYLLATLGELCLSPVGLSMVTKLAPVRFASLLMGVWLLSSSVAQYAGGTIGELWGRKSPTEFFTIFVISSAIGAVLLLIINRPMRKLMHKVH